MRAFYLLILLSIFSVKSFAQEKVVKAEKVRAFYYTFSGIQTKEEALKLEAQISKIQNVKNCKIKIKPEKQMGELYVQYIEPTYQTEKEAKNKVEIEEILKKQIFESGYAPNELKEIK